MERETLNYLFEYRDGNLYWKVATANCVRIGEKAGCISNSTGYVQVAIYGKIYRAHRLIFLMHHGYLPKNVDHINMNRSDNRIENLRDASTMQNQYNATLRVDNKSGFKGVCWDKNAKKWKVQARIGGKVHYFGLYGDLEFADLVAQEVRNKYHGEYARHK